MECIYGIYTIILSSLSCLMLFLHFIIHLCYIFLISKPCPLYTTITYSSSFFVDIWILKWVSTLPGNALNQIHMIKVLSSTNDCHTAAGKYMRLVCPPKENLAYTVKSPSEKAWRLATLIVWYLVPSSL